MSADPSQWASDVLFQMALQVVEQEPAKAAKLYQLAAERYFAPAAYNLAGLYLQGRGVPRDAAKALRLYQLAADLGDLDGLYQVAWMTARGEGCRLDLAKAYERWREAADLFHGPSMLSLGHLYAGRLGPFEFDPLKAAEWYLQAAMRGVKEALSALVSQQSIVTRRAELGSAEAQYILGGIHLLVARDHAQAAYWFGCAANQHHPAALRNLGALYEQGLGVERNLRFALHCYRSAAEGDDTIAQYNLGICYLEGQLVAKNVDRAAQWLTMAAEKNFADAYIPLANVLSLLDQNAEALMWFERSAEQGNVAAMAHVAAWYRNGVGCQRNLVQAARWYFAMLAEGNEEGVLQIQQFAHQLSPAQIREAARLAGRESFAEAAIASFFPNAGGR